MNYRAEVTINGEEGGYISQFSNLNDMRNWINLVRRNKTGQVKIWQSKTTAFVISDAPSKVIEF